MPTKLDIPAKRITVCTPCPHLKQRNVVHSRLEGIRCDYCCVHPDSYEGTVNIPDDPTRAKPVLAVIERLKEKGRFIGVEPNQPSWCPLFKQKSSYGSDAMLRLWLSRMPDWARESYATDSLLVKTMHHYACLEVSCEEMLWGVICAMIEDRKNLKETLEDKFARTNPAEFLHNMIAKSYQDIVEQNEIQKTKPPDSCKPH